MLNHESKTHEISIINDKELSHDINYILNCQIKRINEYEFRQLYQSDEIKRDKELVYENADSESQKLIDTLALGADVCDWLGSEISIIGASNHDANAEKINLLAEFALSLDNPDDEPPVLALSVKIGAGKDELTRQITNNANRLNGSKICHIKYYQSPIYETQCALESAVPVVVALDKPHAEELINLLAEILKLGANIKNTGFNNEIRTQKLKEMVDAFKNNPAQLIFLKEIAGQLELFIGKIDSKTKNGAKITRRLNLIFDAVNNAIVKKNINLNDWEKDTAFQTIASLQNY